MYNIWYKVVYFNYGNYSGGCGNFNNIEDAINKVDELCAIRVMGDTYEIVVNWELSENV